MNLASILYYMLILYEFMLCAFCFYFMLFLSLDGSFSYASASFSQAQEEKRLHLPVHSITPEEQCKGNTHIRITTCHTAASSSPIMPHSHHQRWVV